MIWQRVVYRAGWPDLQNSKHPFRWGGKWWLRLGPFVVGHVASWDRSDAP